MHQRLFVLTAKKNAKTAKDARSYVNNYLLDNHFVSEGRFCGGPADWFVVGGRWSGELTLAQLDQTKVKLFWEEFERRQLGWVSKDKPEEMQRKYAIELFKQYFPTFKGKIVPVYRDTYAHAGYDDDAKIVDKHLWDYIKANVKDLEDTTEIVDTECDEITEENTIGKKWVVIVDYHW